MRMSDWTWAAMPSSAVRFDEISSCSAARVLRSASRFSQSSCRCCSSSSSRFSWNWCGSVSCVTQRIGAGAVATKSSMLISSI